MKQTDIFDRLNNTIGNHMEGKATDQDLISMTYEVDRYLLQHTHPHDLIKNNVGLSDVSEWVAVSNGLPQDDINVLCYHNSGNYFICYRTKDCNTNEPKWFGGAMPDFWKPLPEPPCR